MGELKLGKLRIVVAENHPSIRENLRYLFNAEPDMEVVGVARTATEVLPRVSELDPDVVVVDSHMPGAPGLEVVRQLSTKSAARVVLYTTSTDICDRARADGAAACIAKDAPYDLVVKAVRAAGVFGVTHPSGRARRRSPEGMFLISQPGRPRVLVVDDDEDIRRVIKDVLESEGFETRTVADGAQALLEAARWQPKVIVLDVLMPVMDGRTFLQSYRHAGAASARIVALSGLARAANVAKELGCDAALTKPFEIDHLVRTVAALAGYAPTPTLTN
ncbi:MAG TPA: response regulator [Candidatus Limnocylindria bacterium]|nr:response regulator [Candidatus Limnocylindria bacterium]